MRSRRWVELALEIATSFVLVAQATVGAEAPQVFVDARLMSCGVVALSRLRAMVE